jgi:hypothetical protein
MEGLSIFGTALTLIISFNPSIGVLEIKGRSIPDNPDDFWMPILNWFESYLIQPALKTSFKIDLEYFNIPSSKRMLFLLYKLNELAERGFDVCVEWHYKKEDEDMYEVGQDYAYMVKVPFIFKESDELEVMPL